MADAYGGGVLQGIAGQLSKLLDHRDQMQLLDEQFSMKKKLMEAEASAAKEANQDAYRRRIELLKGELAPMGLTAEVGENDKLNLRAFTSEEVSKLPSTISAKLQGYDQLAAILREGEDAGDVLGGPGMPGAVGALINSGRARDEDEARDILNSLLGLPIQQRKMPKPAYETPQKAIWGGFQERIAGGMDPKQAVTEVAGEVGMPPEEVDRAIKAMVPGREASLSEQQSAAKVAQDALVKSGAFTYDSETGTFENVFEGTWPVEDDYEESDKVAPLKKQLKDALSKVEGDPKLKDAMLRAVKNVITPEYLANALDEAKGSPAEQIWKDIALLINGGEQPSSEDVIIERTP